MITPKIFLSGLGTGLVAVVLFSFPAAAEAVQSIPKVICGPGTESLQSRLAPTFNLAQDSIDRIDLENLDVKADSEVESDAEVESPGKPGGQPLEEKPADDVKVDVNDDSARLVLQSKNGVSPFLKAGMGEGAQPAADDEYGAALVKNEGPSVYSLGAGIGCVLDPGAQLKVGYQFETSDEATPLEKLTGDRGGKEDEHKISVDLKFSF